MPDDVHGSHPQDAGQGEGDTLTKRSSQPPSETAPEPVRALMLRSVADDAAYSDSIRLLRARPREAIQELADAEQRCPADDHDQRFFYVSTAGELQHSAAIPFLTRIIQRDYERRPAPVHAYSPSMAEEVLKIAAVQGLRHLARAGDEEAVQTMVRFLAHPCFAVRASIVASLASLPDRPDIRTTLEHRLTGHDRMLREITPGMAPQPVPPSPTARRDGKDFARIRSKPVRA